MREQMAHLEAEVLAEFRAGLITGRRGAQITAHLAGCDRCTALDDQLAGVSVLLASVPMPAMPDRVAQRLDTVLAAEAARTDHAERARADRPAHPATGRRTPRPGFRLPSLRVLAPVAAGVVLAAGGYGISRAIGPGSHATASSASSASSAGRSVASSQAGGAAARPAAPTAAASSQFNAPQSPPVRGAAGTAPQARRLTPANFTLVAGTVNFSSSPAVLKRQIEHELAAAPPAKASVISLPVTAQLRACVQNLTHGASLVRVESARFGGQPATLVVARAGQRDTAWIAGPDCSATSRDVLATTSVPAGISEP